MSAQHSSEAVGHDDHSPYKPGDSIWKHSRPYMIVFGILTLFTIITVAISYVHFGSHAMNIAIGLAVASFKAACVALIFMHLNHERRLIYVVLFFTVLFAVACVYLTWFDFADPIPGEYHFVK